jgi:hypothetical protein
MSKIRIWLSISAVIILLLISFVSVSCNSEPEVLKTEPNFTGLITEIYPVKENETLGQIQIAPQDDNLADNYIITIKDETQIYERNGVEQVRGTFKTLGTNQQVQVWLREPIMDSYPRQGIAQQVVITLSTEPTPPQLAEYWSPVWWQDTDDGDFRADYITNIDFDGDWDSTNNWDNMPQYELKAYIYYWIAETTTHWFIGYADFHPRDWSDDITAPWDQHENDMEGCLIVIQKTEGYYGEFILMITRAHDNFYSYKDYESSLSNQVKNGHEDIDGDIEFESGHPYVYVKAEGHAVYGDLRWENNGFPGGDGVVYRYTGQAEEPTNGNDRNAGYDLVNIDELWAKRYDPDIFYDFGIFIGDDFGENKAHAPWGWDDKDDGEVSADQFFIDPAYLISYYHDGLGNFSHDYIVQFQNE